MIPLTYTLLILICKVEEPLIGENTDRNLVCFMINSIHLYLTNLQNQALKLQNMSFVGALVFSHLKFSAMEITAAEGCVAVM